MSSNCTITFDQNEYGTYFTGQMITGKVMVTHNKAKKIIGIKLQICGYAYCNWRDRHGDPRPVKKAKKTRKHTYYGREDYIASTTYLVGSEHGQQFSMDAGTYTYQFACPIPANCPSSFEGTYGHIRYLAKVTTIRSCSSNRTHTVGFTVLKLLDLNQESRLLKAPANNEAMEHFCFVHTKPVHLKVDILQTGYVPGQIMLVSAEVKNDTRVDVKCLMIKLNLRATYTSDTPCLRTTSEKICLVKKICGPVARQTVKNFAETLRIPATAPTCEHLSKIVRVSYEICVSAEMKSLMINPKTTIPITIGNVPLRDNPMLTVPAATAPLPAVPADLPSTSAGAMELAASQSSLLSQSQEESEDDDVPEAELPPPSYEQAMFMTANIVEEDANTVSEVTQFTPRYPVYDVDDTRALYAQGPPPNLPQKRRRRKKKKPLNPVEEEKQPVESPIQI